jgi:hypothetical protein
MDMVECFEMRKRQEEESLAAIEDGRVIRIVQTTLGGPVDVTEEHRVRLRKAIDDYQRAADSIRGPPPAQFQSTVKR